MDTLTLIFIGFGVMIVMWGAIEYYAWKTGRKLITYHMRRAPKLVIFIIAFVIGLLAGHFWWCPT